MLFFRVVKSENLKGFIHDFATGFEDFSIELNSLAWP
jgi:hypothetical protein